MSAAVKKRMRIAIQKTNAVQLNEPYLDSRSRLQTATRFVEGNVPIRTYSAEKQLNPSDLEA